MPNEGSIVLLPKHQSTFLNEQHLTYQYFLLNCWVKQKRSCTETVLFISCLWLFKTAIEKNKRNSAPSAQTNCMAATLNDKQKIGGQIIIRVNYGKAELQNNSQS